MAMGGIAGNSAERSSRLSGRAAAEQSSLEFRF
jgi:hypothetical protein